MRVSQVCALWIMHIYNQLSTTVYSKWRPTVYNIFGRSFKMIHRKTEFEIAFNENFKSQKKEDKTVKIHLGIS